MILKQRPGVCRCCQQPVVVKTMTAHPSAAAVEVAVCSECDRRRCQRCKHAVVDPGARRCPCGQVL